MMTSRVTVVGILLATLVIQEPCLAQAPPPLPSIQGAHVRVDYTPGLDPWARSIAVICDTAWEFYAAIYGLSLPTTLHVHLTLDPKQTLRLYTDGDDTIFLQLSNERQLLPPGQGGPHNVYGFCHEMGHIVFYHRMRNTTGMPAGLAEGWAHYLGSVIVSHVFQKLGEQAWPQPHNYLETSGWPRLQRQIQDPQQLQRSAETRAAKILYDLDQHFGPQVTGRIISRALAQRPAGNELAPRFAAALVEVTGDPRAAQWMPQEFLETGVQWSTQHRDIADPALYRELKSEQVDGLTRLRYDDGSMEGKRSMAGSGHAVVFRPPEGKWQLTAVEIFGSRYGTAQPPQEAFSIFLCDADFEVIREFKIPYARFQRGAEKWVRCNVPPTEAPEFFYLCVSFNPTATKGIYVGYDESASGGHSRLAVPGSHVRDAQGFDWMMRACLKPVEP